MKTLFVVLLVVVSVAWFGSTGFAGVLAQDEAPECRLNGDPLLFGVSSFVLPGLGQFFVGQDGKALLHFVVAVGLPTTFVLVGSTIAVASPQLGFTLMLAAPLAYLGWSVFSAIDAHDTSKQYCQA